MAHQDRVAVVYDSLLDTWIQSIQQFQPAIQHQVAAAVQFHTVSAVAASKRPLQISCQPVATGEVVDVSTFTQVVVVIRDGEQCLMLTRSPNQVGARPDLSTLALPSLRTTSVLGGVYRAQHALNLLFGPARSFEGMVDMHSSLTLEALVDVSGPTTDRLGVYVCQREKLSHYELREIFTRRRCTPTQVALFPGFELSSLDKARDKLSAVDVAILESVFWGKGTAPMLAPVRFDVPLPAESQEADMSETAGPARNPRRSRPLAPGEQPPASEVALGPPGRYATGHSLPQIDDPLSVLQQMVPDALLTPTSDTRAAQATDETCIKIRQWMAQAEEGKPPRAPKEDLHLQTFFNSHTFVEHNGLLQLRDDQATHASDGSPHLRIVMPADMIEPFLTALHDGFGHPGVKRTLRLASSRVWCPQMKVKVTNVLSRCPTCLFNKVPPYHGEQHIPPNGDHPWHSVQIDLVHLSETRSGKAGCLIAYDRMTRDVEAFATPHDATTDDVLNLLIFQVFYRHGWPRVLYTDRGSNLISRRARVFFSRAGIRLCDADAHMHTAVAGCERFNASLREIARAASFDHGFEWDIMLPLLLFWYKQLVQSATGFSPFYLNHGRDAVSPWDLQNGPSLRTPSIDEYVQRNFSALFLAWACARSDVGKQEMAQRTAHNRKYRTNVTFQKGQRVLILQAGRKSKMHMPYVGPYKIAEVLGRDRYRLEGRANARRDHHEFFVSRLKLWPEGAEEDDIYVTEEYFDVDFIVDHRWEKDPNTGEERTLYRVRWCGYGALDDSWIPFTDMNAPCAREAYEYMREITDLSGQVIPAQVAARRVALQAERDPPGSSPMTISPPQGKGSVSAPSAPTPSVTGPSADASQPAPPVTGPIADASQAHSDARNARQAARQLAKEARQAQDSQ